MIKVGECYYHNGVEHLIVAVSKKENKCLIVSITSNNFDKSCELNVEDIIDNNGNQVEFVKSQDNASKKNSNPFRVVSKRCSPSHKLNLMLLSAPYAL